MELAEISVKKNFFLIFYYANRDEKLNRREKVKENVQKIASKKKKKTR